MRESSCDGIQYVYFLSNINKQAGAKQVGIGAGIGIAVDIGKKVSTILSIPTSVPNSDNAVQPALSGSQPEATGFAVGYLLFRRNASIAGTARPNSFEGEL